MVLSDLFLLCISKNDIALWSNIHRRDFSWHRSTSSVYWPKVLCVWNTYSWLFSLLPIFLIDVYAFYIFYILAPSVICVASIVSHFVVSPVPFFQWLLILIWSNISVSLWIKPLYPQIRTHIRRGDIWYMCTDINIYIYISMWVYTSKYISIIFMILNLTIPKQICGVGNTKVLIYVDWKLFSELRMIKRKNAS